MLQPGRLQRMVEPVEENLEKDSIRSHISYNDMTLYRRLSCKALHHNYPSVHIDGSISRESKDKSSTDMSQP